MALMLSLNVCQQALSAKNGLMQIIIQDEGISSIISLSVFPAPSLLNGTGNSRVCICSYYGKLAMGIWGDT